MEFCQNQQQSVGQHPVYDHMQGSILFKKKGLSSKQNIKEM